MAKFDVLFLLAMLTKGDLGSNYRCWIASADHRGFTSASIIVGLGLAAMIISLFFALRHRLARSVVSDDDDYDRTRRVSAANLTELEESETPIISVLMWWC